jgi:hypothetical protein
VQFVGNPITVVAAGFERGSAAYVQYGGDFPKTTPLLKFYPPGLILDGLGGEAAVTRARFDYSIALSGGGSITGTVSTVLSSSFPAPRCELSGMLISVVHHATIERHAGRCCDRYG